MSTAVAERSNGQARPQLTIKQHLESDAFKASISKVLPKHVTPERMARVAVTALTRQPKLAECDQVSFFRCLMDLSQWGLEPDGRRAHLIPFENRKRGVVECQLIIDYKGLVELALRSGSVSYIHADIVCENDTFEYDRGELKKHKIDFRSDRGRMYAAYALVRMKDGTEKCEVLSKDEIDGIRARSKASGTGPWVTDYNEMAKKTAFRRVSKWIPLSAELRDAAELDDDVIDGSFSAAVTQPQINKLDDLTDRLIQAPESVTASDVCSATEVPAATETPSEAAKSLINELTSKLESATGINEVKELATEARASAAATIWPDDLKAAVDDQIVQLGDERIASIRATRGEGSNK